MMTRLNALRWLRAIQIKSGAWSASIALLLGGGAVVAAPPLPGVLPIGWASIAFGSALLIWGVRIYGQFFWQPWWRGKPSPFSVMAGVRNIDYASGSVAYGITWQPGFSHVFVKIRNESAAVAQQVDALVGPENPIIHSSARCDFAECKIAPLRGKTDVTAVYKLSNGKKIAEVVNFEQPGNYAIGPYHRLRCDDLPSGAEIRVDLATVVMEEQLAPGKFWKKDRSDPANILIVINWVEDGCPYVAKLNLPLKGVDAEG